MSDESLFDATEDVFGEEEYADAQKPIEVFAEGEYPVVIESAGDEENETAVIKPNSIQVELVLEATREADGATTRVWHNQTLALRTSDVKKQKRVRGMVARFYGAFGFSAAEANAVHRALLAREPGAAKVLEGRISRATIGVGKNLKGKDRNEVVRFVLPSNGRAV